MSSPPGEWALRVHSPLRTTEPHARRTRPARPPRAAARQLKKQDRLVDIAMTFFAEHGYERARIEDIAREAGVSKGAVFSYFGSKTGLFFATYKSAVRSFHCYLDAPSEVLEAGFFPTVSYWLERTTQLIHESYVPYRVSLIGYYCSDVELRREITQFLLREDPYGTRAFIDFGIGRGEVRDDIDVKTITSLFEWVMDHCQDAVVAEELDPGLFGGNTATPEDRHRRYEEVVELLRSAIGAR
jgi:AcrR family transcriptional regulator